MILADFQIREAIEKGWIKVDPFKEGSINPASLNIHVGYEFFEVVPSFKDDYHWIDPLDKESFITKKYPFNGKYLFWRNFYNSDFNIKTL